MADPASGEGLTEHSEAIEWAKKSRKEKRKILKKLKRKKARTEAAIREREEDARLNALEQQLPLRLREHEEAEQAERNRREFEERERVWIKEAAARKAREDEEQHRKKILEVEERKIHEVDDEYEYVEEGPPEIIWQGNEIIIKKGRVKIAKGNAEQYPDKKLQDDNRPTSNPLPPPSAAFASCTQREPGSMQEVLDTVAHQVPNFGTEQDKAHCPFHLKTGACRFGSRCSRVHFYPEKSCTLLIKNMYNGPGLTCEQDEGLEYTDEEIERCYEEFYEDVHTEFLKFGEIVNFKVCKNTSYHLRGNVYVHFKSLESAITAYNTMNARYYAGKQISCEFAGITKWKIAICGEFMKSRLKTCSHGSACNFIHCFRNPGGDYEWADWDNPPPRYWIKKMVVLFGTSLESSYDSELESDDYHRHNEPIRARKSRNYRSSCNESDWNYNGSSDGNEELNPQKHKYIRYSVAGGHYSKRRGRRVSDDNDDTEETTSKRHQRADVNNRRTLSRHERGRESEEGSSRRRKVYSAELENSGSEDRSSSRRKRKVYCNEKENSESEGRSSSRRKRKVYSEELENSESEVISSSKRKRKVYSDENENTESEDRWSGRRMKTVYSDENENFESEGRSYSRRKIKVYTEEKENSRCKRTSKSHEKQETKHESGDRYLDLDCWDSTNGHSLKQFDEKYSFSEDIDSEKDFCGVRYSYSSQSGRRRK